MIPIVDFSASDEMKLAASVRKACSEQVPARDLQNPVVRSIVRWPVKPRDIAVTSA